VDSSQIPLSEILVINYWGQRAQNASLSQTRRNSGRRSATSDNVSYVRFGVPFFAENWLFPKTIPRCLKPQIMAIMSKIFCLKQRLE
jgi:hypothetical protein